MKKQSLALVIAASVLGTSLSAFAQQGPGGGGGPDGGQQQDQGGGHGGGDHGGVRDHGVGRDHPGGGVERRGGPVGAGGPGSHGGHGGHGGFAGPVPHSDWHRGGRVPPDFRGPRYVIDDWRAYDLQPPPDGYEWLQVNGDFVLVAITTGVIASILLGPHY